MMLDCVISGGQTGADQAGWRAAKAAGIPTGGKMPRGYLTEDGERPGLREEFGAKALGSPAYPPRTRANVEDSDGTIWFGNPDSRGGRSTLAACVKAGRPFLPVRDGMTTPRDVVAWIQHHRIAVLNVAGNRASTDPELGPRVEAFLGRVFRLLSA